MKRASFVLVVPLFALGASVATVDAQEVDRPIHVGIMGGATAPLSILNDASSAGWNLGALVRIGAARSPFSLRLDAQWIQLGHSNNLFACLTAGFPLCEEPVSFNFRVIDGTANVVYTIHQSPQGKYYLIGGGGVYGERATLAVGGSRSTATKFGMNAGAGVDLRLGSFSAFLEARYHNILTRLGDRQLRESRSEVAIPAIRADQYGLRVLESLFLSREFS